jgi:hypothetical protein
MNSLVYVVAMPSFNYVKIGMTDDLKGRIKAMQTSCPETRYYGANATTASRLKTPHLAGRPVR